MVPLVLAGALLTRNGCNIAATCGLLVVAWAYSVPPLRLKERPPLDSLANGLGFFLLPFVMGYSLGADPAAMPLKYYLLALSVCGIHALATAADYEADKAAGHRTLGGGVWPSRGGGLRTGDVCRRAGYSATIRRVAVRVLSGGRRRRDARGDARAARSHHRGGLRDDLRRVSRRGSLSCAWVGEASIRDALTPTLPRR